MDKKSSPRGLKVAQNEKKVAQRASLGKDHKRNIVYQCICCNYKSNKSSNYKKHLKSKKHLKMSSQKVITNPEKSSQSRKSHHNPEKVITNPENSSQEKDKVASLEKQVKQLTNLVGILVEKGVSTTNNTNCNNTIINNHITVDVYLNDHCKDALNIRDFVNQIQVKLEDCVYPSKLIKDNIVSNLFMNNLNKLSNEERPVHCADARRGKFFVKDNDEWTEIKKEEPLNPLNSQIGMLKLEVYKKAGNFEEEGLIKEDKKQKIREACEISGPPTKINNKILKNIETDCSIHEARKKKSLNNID